MKSREFLKKTHRMIALGLVLGLLCMTCACGATDSRNTGGSMANDTPAQQDIGATPGVNRDQTNGTTRGNDRVDSNDASVGITDMGGADGTDNVSILDDVGDTISNVVDDTANGVSNVTDDLVGNR